MSFGRPPGFTTFSVTPPDRGSFPLDHDGECTQAMREYMRCLKENARESGKCRHLSRDYLQCRMENGLMEKEEMKNLGFKENESAAATQKKPAQAPIPKPSQILERI